MASIREGESAREELYILDVDSCGDSPEKARDRRKE